MGQGHSPILVTYGIPIYKAPLPLLKKLIHSIEAQSVHPYEILVVVDGEDANKALLESNFLNNVRHLRTIIQQHGGPSQARNRIISEANGKWLLFADADDHFYPKATSRLLAAGENNNADLIASNHSRVTGNRETFVTYYEQVQSWRAADAGRFVRHILSMGSDQGTVWSKLFRTSFLRTNHLQFNPKLRNGEDQEFLLRVALAQPSITVIPAYTYAYVHNPTSIVRLYDTHYAQHILNTLDAVRSDLCEANLLQDLLGDYRRYSLDRLLLILRNYTCHKGTMAYGTRKREFLDLISLPVFDDALRSDFRGIDFPRKLTLSAAKHRCLWIIDLIIRFRYLQQSLQLSNFKHTRIHSLTSERN